MSLNFFKAECQTRTNAMRFGLFDPENQMPAKIIFDNEEDWNATVINDKSIIIYFTAIDNCVEVLRDDGEKDRSCDVMMVYNNILLLVEIKHKRKEWQLDGLSQIESTIKKMIFDNSEFYYSFTKRQARVVNRKYESPYFQEFHAEQREYFWKNYKVRNIQFDSEIMIQ